MILACSVEQMMDSAEAEYLRQTEPHMSTNSREAFHRANKKADPRESSLLSRLNEIFKRGSSMSYASYKAATCF